MPHAIYDSVANVYARELDYLKYGRALWVPENSVEIGDVGMIDPHHGGFRRLFNVTRPTDDPLNSHGVPDGFQVLELDTAIKYRIEDPVFIQNHVLHSKSITLESFSNDGNFSPYVSGKDDGALLTLGSDGHMLRYRKNRIFEGYILKHYESWRTFACRLGQVIPRNRNKPGLIFISGWIRASSCDLVCYHNNLVASRAAGHPEDTSCIFISYHWIKNDDSSYRRLLPKVECLDVGPPRHKHAEIRARFTTEDEDDASDPFSGNESPTLSLFRSFASTSRTRDARVPLTISPDIQVRLQSLYSEDGSKERGAVLYLPHLKPPTKWATWKEAAHRQHSSSERFEYHNSNLFNSTLSIAMFKVNLHPVRASLDDVQVACPICYTQLPSLGSLAIYCSDVCEAIDVIMLIMFSQPPLMGRIAIRPFIAPVLAKTTDTEALNMLFAHCGKGGHSLVDFVKRCLNQVSVVVPSDAPREMHHAVRLRLRHALARLCQLSDSLPTSFILRKIDQSETQVAGCGGYADVYRGSYKGQAVAIKHLRAFSSATPEDSDLVHKRFKLEVVICKNLSHESILPFLGVSINDDLKVTRLISPWMDNGNIRQYLTSLKLQGEYNHDDIVTQIYIWILQIIIGLEYLHSSDVVHSDLRGPNVLLGPDLHCKLTDFGLSVFASSASAQLWSLRGGNPHWLSTEILDPPHYGLTSERPTYMSDVWSFACVCIELFTNADPLAEVRSFAICTQVVHHGVRPKRPSLPGGPEMISPLWEILQKCWREHRSERPTARELVSMLQDVLPITAQGGAVETCSVCAWES